MLHAPVLRRFGYATTILWTLIKDPIDRPHQLRSTKVGCRIMKYRRYLWQNLSFSFTADSQLAATQKATTPCLGTEKMLRKSCMGLTQWLVGFRFTCIQLPSFVWVLWSSLCFAIFCCRFAARTVKHPLECDVTQLAGRVFAMRCITCATISLTSHRCPTGPPSNWHKQSSHWIAFFLLFEGLPDSSPTEDITRLEASFTSNTPRGQKIYLFTGCNFERYGLIWPVFIEFNGVTVVASLAPL